MVESGVALFPRNSLPYFAQLDSRIFGFSDVVFVAVSGGGVT